MRLSILFVVTLLTSGIAQARVPFWGDKTSMPVETDPADVNPPLNRWSGASGRRSNACGFILSSRERNISRWLCVSWLLIL